MAYTLNTNHALYPYLIELIGVQGGAMVSHKTARTFTPKVGATFGSGTWGEHLKTGAKAWDPSGVTFTPSIPQDSTGGAPISIFFAINNIASAADGTSGALTFGIPGYGITTQGQRAMGGNTSPDPYTSLNTVGVGAVSIAVARNGEVSNTSYVNGVQKATGGQLNFNQLSNVGSLGGQTGQGVCGGIEFVWYAAFSKLLTAQEVLDLHNSLGSNNAIGLIVGGGGGTDATAPGVTLTGTATLTPGAASGASSGSAPGATLTGSATLTPGSATGASSGSAPGVTLTSSATLTPGSATGGGVPTTGSFTISEALENNAGSLWLNQPVAWTWTPTGRVGSMVGKTPIDGSGTTHATTGLLTIPGLPLGAGQCDIAVLGATPADDAVYRTYGTVV